MNNLHNPIDTMPQLWKTRYGVINAVPGRCAVSRSLAQYGEWVEQELDLLSEFIAEDCILAWAWDGKDITPDHGWPLRGLVPRLYLWKSAKWIRGIELRTTDAPGFWEQGGYHMHGDPWKEERFGW